MKKQYFGTDGIRGKVGEGKMTPLLALKLGWAAGKVLARRGTHTVLIGKDTRISGYMFESSLEAGLVAAGVNIKLLGPMPTPAVAYLTHTFRAEAGIVISASHNPYYDNGIKFFGADGRKLSDEIELAIEQELDKDMECVESSKLGKVTRIENASGRYIEFCKSHFPLNKSLKGLKIVVDCAHGATYHIAPLVFTELGADVISIGVEPNGLNINDNCGATSMTAVCQKVIETKADLGVAIDGDGDRLMMVDHDGQIIDGDQILYILAKSAKITGRLEGGVVGTSMSNLALELALKKLDIPFVRANVGDKHVSQSLIDNNWKIGGESSGHIIHCDHGTTGDGVVAAVLVLAAMIEQKKNLQELLADLVLYPQCLLNVHYDGQSDPLSNSHVNDVVDSVESELKEKQSRLLLRKSGTEPLIRVMVEGEDPTYIHSMAERVSQAIEEVV